MAPDRADGANRPGDPGTLAADPGAEPADPDDEPTEPTEPTEPADPDDEPTEPTEPTDPDDEPTEPTEPTEPDTLADPGTEPTEPDTLADPGAGPADPDMLADPRRLGDLDRGALAVALRPLFEDAGPLIDRLAGRSWLTWGAVLDAAEVEVAVMPADERALLLQAHPRIGAPAETLRARSAISLAEQGGGEAIPEPARLRLDVLNGAYERRFGFPFVEFVAGRPPEELIEVLEGRLERPRDSELQEGCDALLAIARDRLRHRFTNPS